MNAGIGLLTLGLIVAIAGYFLASGTVATVLLVIGVVMALGGLIDILRRGGSGR